MWLSHRGDLRNVPENMYERVEVVYVYIMNINKIDMEMLYENDIRAFTAEILRNNFNLVPQVYVEHKRMEVHVVYPNLLMKVPTNIHIKVAHNPNAIVEDCMNYVFDIMGFWIPRRKMKDLVVVAEEAIKCSVWR
ncbi:hypothetical protein LXL04_032958 [Taraxacum kok-saghyz]